MLLDANCVNARGGNPQINQLERWRQDGVILVEYSQASYEEALAGGAPNRAPKVMSHVFTLPIGETDEDRSRAAIIESILFPEGCKDRNQRNDVETVLYALKHHRVLVTLDGGSRKQPGGILGNRERLLKAVGVQIMKPEEAVGCIRSEIERRDNLAKACISQTGCERHDWVGED